MRTKLGAIKMLYSKYLDANRNYFTTVQISVSLMHVTAPWPNGQFQSLAKFLLKHEKQNLSPQLKRSYQK